MTIKYLGHSCISMETMGKTLIFDPFITGNPLASGIDPEALRPDFILLTHGHGDHVLDLESVGKHSNPFIISNYEIVTWASEKHGLEGHGMNLGGKYEFPFGTVKYVNAIHSSTLPDGSSGGNPGGFVLWNEEGCVYIAGDTALTEDMKLIPATCPELDLAVLPVGDNFTMGFRDAVIASDYIQCNRVMGYHYDTFPPIGIDHEAAKEVFRVAGKELILLDIGASIEV